MAPRTRYGLLFLAIIAMGLLSRQWAIIPVFTGDFLYAMMVYCGWRWILINKPIIFAAIIGLILCYLIELSQLIEHQEALTYIRSFRIGKLILGQGFLFSDLIAYTLGSIFIYYIDRRWIKTP